MTRHQVYQDILALFEPLIMMYPELKLRRVLAARYNVPEARLMTLEQLQDLRDWMSRRLQAKDGTNEKAPY